jgi:hypothetical protein
VPDIGEIGPDAWLRNCREQQCARIGAKKSGGSNVKSGGSKPRMPADAGPQRTHSRPQKDALDRGIDPAPPWNADREHHGTIAASASKVGHLRRFSKYTDKPMPTAIAGRRFEGLWK